MNTVHRQMKAVADVHEDFIILQLNNKQSVLKLVCLSTENIVTQDVVTLLLPV
jgi:hypothetical protein